MLAPVFARYVVSALSGLGDDKFDQFSLGESTVALRIGKMGSD